MAVSELITELSVTANDTIFFYYSGHGGNDDRGHYLGLPQGRLYRSELRQLLENKGARLVVLITDCCNQRSDGQAFGAPYMDMEPPAKVSPLFESLFLLPKGTVDINSSSPGEAAYFFPFGSETELAPSSIFTGEFVSFLDRAEHVVLKECQTVPSEEFFAIVGQAIEAQNSTSRDCLVYVHGFNVSFDEAARRAAQIHIDLQFQGATLFYSWPSRGQVQSYFSDRNEIVVSKGLLTSFIREVHARLKVDRLHIIAHSMGADATAQAILDLDPQAKILDQIVLAAPDIDAVYFQSILPRLNERSSGTTLYCSKNDWALLASRRFNDSVRAGDSSLGPLVVEGLDTIDASYMDTEMLGHSYYGNCLPLLEDLQQLIKQASPPRMRKLEEVVLGPAKAYWVFGD